MRDERKNIRDYIEVPGGKEYVAEAAGSQGDLGSHQNSRNNNSASGDGFMNIPDDKELPFV